VLHDRVLFNHEHVQSTLKLVAQRVHQEYQRLRTRDHIHRFVALTEKNRDCVTLSSLDGRLLYFNQTGREMLGVPPDLDVTTLNASLFLPPAVQALVQALPSSQDGDSTDASSTDDELWQGESQLRHWQSGEDIPVEVRLLRLRDSSDGKPFALGCIQRDLREAKRAEHALRQAKKIIAACLKPRAKVWSSLIWRARFRLPMRASRKCWAWRRKNWWDVLCATGLSKSRRQTAPTLAIRHRVVQHRVVRHRASYIYRT
jgi:PAS domain-containing protein